MDGALRKPPDAGHVDLSMTRCVLDALKASAVPPSDPTVTRGAGISGTITEPRRRVLLFTGQSGDQQSRRGERRFCKLRHRDCRWCACSTCRRNVRFGRANRERIEVAEGPPPAGPRARIRGAASGSASILGIGPAPLLCARHFPDGARFAGRTSASGERRQLPERQQPGEGRRPANRYGLRTPGAGSPRLKFARARVGFSIPRCLRAAEINLPPF